MVPRHLGYPGIEGTCQLWSVVTVMRGVVVRVDTDKARKHGLDEFVQANPSKFDHHDLFSMLQRLTLVYRLNDNFACLVRVHKPLPE